MSLKISRNISACFLFHVCFALIFFQACGVLHDRSTRMYICSHRYEWRMNLFEGTAFNLIPFGKKSYVNLINTQSTWRSFVSWAAGLHVDLSGPDPPCLSSPIFECISIRATEEKEPPVLQNFRAPFQLFSGPNGAKTSLRVGELWIDSMRSMHSNTHKAIQLQNALSGRTCLFWTPV